MRPLNRGRQKDWNGWHRKSLEETQKARLEGVPFAGVESASVVNEIFKTDGALVVKSKVILQ